MHFLTGNILNSFFMEGLGSFDVIFFRNILIYFDGLSRHQAIATLYKILADDGLLFVGHAEANLLNNSPFTSASYPQAFAFHKKPKLQLKAESKATPGSKQQVRKRKTSSGNPLLRPLRKAEHETPDLELAHKLADKGELQKATAICEKYLEQYGPSVQAFFLLGIIRDAANDPEQAEKLFRKALYLNPNHEETLIFLSLLTEKSGAVREARTLKQRLGRLQQKKASQKQES